MKNSYLHYRYAISFLVVALASTIAFALFDVPDLVDKIAFALTITSLVLGVVAIFYTITSGNKQESLLIRLVETNQEITSASAQIKNSAQQLSESIKLFPERFDSVDVKLDSLKSSYLANLDSVSKEPDTEESQTEPAEETPVTEEIEKPSKHNVVEFFVALPYIGMATLYLLSRAHSSQIVIDEKLIEKIELKPFHYVLGLSNGAQAAGLLKIKYTPDSIEVKSLSPAFGQSINKLVEKVLNRVEKDRTSPHVLRKMIDRVDSEFA